jgi:hypothetical protein
MKTIELTEKEHRYLRRFLEHMLSNDTYLGSKFLELGTRSQAFYLSNVKNKLRFAEHERTV